MRIRAVIIDDERSIRELLRQTLEQNFADIVEVVGEAEDVAPGADLIRTQQPDLVFLDIKMKRGTGFDLLEELGEQDFEAVFITAFDDHALEAFRFSAFGYLLKPVKLADLEKVLRKLSAQLEERVLAKSRRLKVLIEHYAGEQVHKLVIKNMRGFQVLELKQIVRLESEVNYTHFFTAKGAKHTSSRTIKHYDELLRAHGFYRVHQQHVVNLAHVVRYEKGEGGSVVLSDGVAVPLAKKRKPGFLQRFL